MTGSLSSAPQQDLLQETSRVRRAGERDPTCLRRVGGELRLVPVDSDLPGQKDVRLLPLSAGGWYTYTFAALGEVVASRWKMRCNALIAVPSARSQVNASTVQKKINKAEYAAHAAAPRRSSTPGIRIHRPKGDVSNAGTSVRRSSLPHSGQGALNTPHPRKSYSQPPQTKVGCLPHGLN